MASTVIIGAGPAGLTAGYELMKLGHGSTVLEADDHLVGGISRTVNYKGYRFDIGGHRFFSKVKLVNELWNEMLGEEFLLRPRLSRIHYNGHYFDYPLRAGNALAGLGPYQAMMVCLSYAKTKFRPSAEEKNFEQWVANRFGYRLYQIFFKTYTEKVWGIPCTEISADWAAQRIKNLSLTEAVRSALFSSQGKTKDGQVITSLIDKFHYPRYGPGMMWEHCQAKLADKGNETLKGIKIDRVVHRNGRVQCVYGQSSSGEKVEYSGDQYISTMPLRHLVQALDPPPPPEVLKAANNLRYRDFLTVVLIINRADTFPDNWIYIHTPSIKMGRVQNYKSWSPDMVPDPSRSSLGLEYFLWDDDDEWNWPDEKLIELGTQECQQIGLIDASEVVDGTVVRMKKAYPIYDQEYLHNVDLIRRYLEGITNLQTIGRNGQHRYNNQDHSMLAGVFAARNIDGAQYDVWSVNVDQEYHEEGHEDDKTATPSTSGERMVPKRIEPDQEEIESDKHADELIQTAFARLDPLAMGVALGVVGGLGLLVVSLVLLFKGGPLVGKNLAVLRHFFIGYTVTWPGLLIGVTEVALFGFGIGYVGSCLRNWGMSAFTHLLKRRAQAQARRDILDQV